MAFNGNVSLGNAINGMILVIGVMALLNQHSTDNHNSAVSTEANFRILSERVASIEQELKDLKDITLVQQQKGR